MALKRFKVKSRRFTAATGCKCISNSLIREIFCGFVEPTQNYQLVVCMHVQIKFSVPIKLL